MKCRKGEKNLQTPLPLVSFGVPTGPYPGGGSGGSIEPPSETAGCDIRRAITTYTAYI